MARIDGHALSGLRILVVEDTWLVAEVIMDQLRDEGCEIVGPASRLKRALEFAREANFDGALLDVNLAGEYCFPVAQVLGERGIPFVFLTGYGEDAIPAEYRSMPRLMKPFRNSDLVRAASERFGR